MTVKRSVFYVRGNNEKMVTKSPEIPPDIITLDLEDSVPPAEKPKAREMTRENLKYAGSGGSTVYVRVNNWETLMTNDDLEAIVHEGLSGGVWLNAVVRIMFNVSIGNWKSWSEGEA